MDITNKAIEVSNRMQEIEYRLACNDLMVRDAEDLRYEYAELEEWNHCLNAYFKIRAENEKLKAQVEQLREIARAVANIGVDFGFGEYELEQGYIEKSRKLLEVTSKE